MEKLLEEIKAIRIGHENAANDLDKIVAIAEENVSRFRNFENEDKEK